MKKIRFSSGILSMLVLVLLFACASPISLTTWHDPNDHSKISRVVIVPMFAKLEYVKPFEQSMSSYFNQMGLKSLGSLDFLNPNKTYTMDQVRAKIDSLGADAVLIFKYTGTNKELDYTPPTYYGGYAGGWGWGGGFYGGYTGGYWTTTSTVNLKALLYNVKNTSGPIWNADVSVTDPNYVDQSALQLAQKIYADWLNYGLVNTPAKK